MDGYLTAPVTVSAPGSIMITGEHAVTQGHPAIVAAIEQRATVRVSPVDVPMLTITSEIAPPQVIPMDRLVANGPYRFVIAAVLACEDRLYSGVQIAISSKIDPTLGLGSSAAVTVAVLAAFLGTDIHPQAHRIILDMQGRGSGADLAASIRGGVLSYRVEAVGAARFEPLPTPPDFSLYNVGYKTPTADVLRLVAERQAQEPVKYDAIYTEMSEVATRMIAQASQKAWEAFGRDMTAYQALMARLGVTDDNLDAAINRALETRGVLGAKISGSGLGDCVVAMGALTPGFLPVELASEGVVFHD